MATEGGGRREEKEEKMERIPCKSMFSNGTEFEMFMEKCFTCSRYRNDHCRILNACYKAMWKPEAFPYDDLLDWEGGYGGKACKSYTDEKPTRARRAKQVDGQMSQIG